MAYTYMLDTFFPRLLRTCWSAATSADPNTWSPDNPAWGQCAVTALLLHEVLQGEILWAEAILPDGRKVSHYFNRIGGKVFDLTRQQFPVGTIIPEGEPRRPDMPTRDYILSFPATAARYALLREAMRAYTHRH